MAARDSKSVVGDWRIVGIGSTYKQMIKIEESLSLNGGMPQQHHATPTLFMCNTHQIPQRSCLLKDSWRDPVEGVPPHPSGSIDFTTEVRADGGRSQSTRLRSMRSLGDEGARAQGSGVRALRDRF